MPEGVAERLAQVNERIARAAKRAGREPDEIELVAVSKFQPVEAVAEAVEAGQLHFGENRFQDTPEKIEAIRARFPDMADKIRWSFIGTLQSNKVKPVLEYFDAIQSIDRIKLLNRADRIAGELNRSVDILLQVNVSGADSQGGVEPEDLPKLAEAAVGLQHVHVQGLMAIGPNTGDEAVIRSGFVTLRKAAEHVRALKLPGVSMDTLSMGMTGDYEIAIEEGATLVRIGTAIFGPRAY